jgi:N-acetylmuramoyl-L-alanine amidase
MRPAAQFFVSTAALALVFFGRAVGADAAGKAAPESRAVPSRPAEPAAAVRLPLTRIAASDYVRFKDVAERLALKSDWTEATRKLVLTDKANRIEFQAEGREVAVNGRRVFLGQPVVLRNGVLYLSRIDFERCLVPLVRPGFGVAPPARVRLIALDPGHGGKFAGTENKGLGLQEKELALDVALRLKKLLEAGGYKVVMTRTTDTELNAELASDLLARPVIANRAGADLFVSIHFNSLSPDTKTSGTEVFTFPPQYQRSDQSWSDGVDDTEKEAAPVNRFDHWSVVLAQAMHRDVLAALKTADRGKKLKHLAVLRGLNCPGVLVESAFLSNDAEARRVATPEVRQQMAAALAEGVRDYAAVIEALEPDQSSQSSATAPPAPASNSRS